MKKLMCSILISITGLCSLAHAASDPNVGLPMQFKGNNIIYFGDSLTDMGNNVADKAPLTNHSGGQYPGRTWAGMEMAPIYFGTTPSNQGGNDYAYAGATTEQVLNQINDYIDSKSGNVSSQNLYVIWAGANDFLGLLEDGNSITPEKVAQTIKYGTYNLNLSISALYSAGARKFLIIGLPDIAQTPLMFGATPDHKIELTMMLSAWNYRLFSTTPDPSLNNSVGLLKTLSNIDPGIQLYYWTPLAIASTMDGYPPLNSNVLYQFTQHPSHYFIPGEQQVPFLNTITETVLGVTKTEPNNRYCSDASDGNCHPGSDPGTPAIPSDPDQYLFFNDIHPTTNAHYLLARYIRECSVLISASPEDQLAARTCEPDFSGN